MIKVNDAEELSGADLADALEQMHVQGRYRELFFMVDTCHGASLQEAFYSPNIIAISSSSVTEDSVSMPADRSIGVTIIDRFTYFVLGFFERLGRAGRVPTLADLFASFDPRAVESTPTVRKDLFKRDPSKVPVTDFFGHAPQDLQLVHSAYPVTEKRKVKGEV